MKPLLSKILILLFLLAPLQAIFASEPQPETTIVPVVILYNQNQEITEILPITDEEGTPYYVHTDHLGGSNVISNTTGAKEELLDYYPYGGIRLDQKAASFDEVKKFTGYEHDADTGLEYAKARYYHSTNAQFISQDPVFWILGDSKQTEFMTRMKLEDMLKDPQMLNSYSYARSNPIIFSDPDGKFAQLLIGAGAGIVGQYGYDVYNNIQANGFSFSAFTSNLSNGKTYITRAAQGAAITVAGLGAVAITSNVVGQAAIVGGASGVSGYLGNSYLGQSTTPQSVITDTLIGGLTFGAVKSTALVPGRLPNFGTEAFFAGKHTQQSAMQLGVDAVASYVSSLVGSFSINGNSVKQNTAVNSQSSNSGNGPLLKTKDTR